ncbi:MAG: TetR/AcrR family transcriptional regulator [Phycisphaerae bacterium]|jgi:AcrR family transcriptional regulator
MANITITRKEKEKTRHKAEILQAALNLFSDKGFGNVSMQDIAAKAEFSVGALYNFFAGKEQLFGELMGDCSDRIYQMLSPIFDSEMPDDEKIRTYIRAGVRLLEDNLKFIRLYVSQYNSLTPAPTHSPKAAENMEIKLKEKLLNTIKSGIRNKLFRAVDEQTATNALCATMEAFVLKSSENFDKAKIEQGLKNIETLFVDNLLKNEGRSNA